MKIYIPTGEGSSAHFSAKLPAWLAGIPDVPDKLAQRFLLSLKLLARDRQEGMFHAFLFQKKNSSKGHAISAQDIP